MTDDCHFDQTGLIIDTVKNPITADSDPMKIHRAKLDAAAGSRFLTEGDNRTVNPPERGSRKGFEFFAGSWLDEDAIAHSRPVFFRSARTRS